jgi:hypothetical protein
MDSSSSSSSSLPSTAFAAFLECTNDSKKIIHLFYNFISNENYDDLYKTIQILLNQYNGNNLRLSSRASLLKMVTLNTGGSKLFRADEVDQTISLGTYIGKVYDLEFGQMFEKKKRATIDCVYNILRSFCEHRNMQILHHHFLRLGSCTIAYIVDCLLTGKSSSFSIGQINYYLCWAFYCVVSKDERAFATFYRETFNKRADYEFVKNEKTRRETKRYIARQVITAYAKCTNYKTILNVIQRNGFTKGLAKLSDECKIVCGNPVMLPKFHVATADDKLNSFEDNRSAIFSCAPFPFGGRRCQLHFSRDAGIKLYDAEGNYITNKLHEDCIAVIINCLSHSEELITCILDCMFTVEKCAKSSKRQKLCYRTDDDNDNDDVGGDWMKETLAAAAAVKNKVFITDLLLYNSEDYTGKTLAERRTVLLEKVITRAISSNELQLIRYEDNNWMSSFGVLASEQKNSLSCRGFMFKSVNGVYPIGRNSSWTFVKTNHFLAMWNKSQQKVNNKRLKRRGQRHKQQLKEVASVN